jgi:hypothetical protein
LRRRAGDYYLTSPNEVRRPRPVPAAPPKKSRGLSGGVAASTVGNRPASPRPASPPPSPRRAPAAADLAVGEYACYGAGGRVMIGLGFKVLPGRRFTDLDGANAGTWSISGTSVTFRGGHLDGQVGRDLKAGTHGARFRIGSMAECEPWH